MIQEYHSLDYQIIIQVDDYGATVNDLISSGLIFILRRCYEC